MKEAELADRLARLETDQANSAGWLQDVSDRLKHVERQVWLASGVLFALQLFLKFYKP